jgi:8-oxo-dGTP diphosphatase
MPEFVFNLRVYGILLQNDELLIAQQIFKNRLLTKFPGGGLQFGEGTIECLKREFIEELNMEVNIVKHYYTTDFFVPSAFHKNNQVISIYYIVASDALNSPEITGKLPVVEGEEQFSWKKISDLSIDYFTLPIDQLVFKNLQNDFRKNII